MEEEERGRILQMERKRSEGKGIVGGEREGMATETIVFLLERTHPPSPLSLSPPLSLFL